MACRLIQREKNKLQSTPIELESVNVQMIGSKFVVRGGTCASGGNVTMLIVIFHYYYYLILVFMLTYHTDFFSGVLTWARAVARCGDGD
jgi:hypothetical protein